MAGCVIYDFIPAVWGKPVRIGAGEGSCLIDTLKDDSIQCHLWLECVDGSRGKAHVGAALKEGTRENVLCSKRAEGVLTAGKKNALSFYLGCFPLINKA